MILAKNQTAGMGRLGRSWVTPPGKCLTMSFIVRRSALSPHAAAVGPAAALAVRALLADFGIPAKVKWPNDVEVDGAKICGILAEQFGQEPVLIIGIGLNVNMTAWDFRQAALGRPATSMRLALGRRVGMVRLPKRLRPLWEARLTRLMSGGFAALRPEWERHDALKGAQIEVRDTAGHAVCGRYLGVDDEGRLCLETTAGEVLSFWSGDVERVCRPS